MIHDQVSLHHAAITRTVQKVLRRRTRDTHLIEDICQDVVLAYLKRDHGTLPDPREAPVGTAALRRFYSDLRRVARSRKLQDFLRQRRDDSSEEDPAQAIEKSDGFVVLLSLLDALPPPYREIAKLRIVDGWTSQRIAEDKGLSVNTVKTQYRRALDRLEPSVKRHFFN